MPDALTFRAELDTAVATALLHAAETEAKRLGLPAPQTGIREWGLFSVNWDISGSLREYSGEFVLKGPDAFGIQDCILDYTLKASFSADLNALKPPLSSLPDLPTVPLSFNFSHALPISGKIALHPHQEGTDWLIDAKIVDPLNIPVQVPSTFLEHMRQVVTEELQKLPVLGNLVESFTNTILQTVAAERIGEMLHPLFNPLVNGLTFYRLPSFMTISLSPPPPMRIQAQVDVQTINLAVTAHPDNGVLALTWTGMVVPKLADTGFSVQLSGENIIHLHLPERGLDEHLL